MTVELDFIQDAIVRQDNAGVEVTRRARLKQRGQKETAQRQALEAPGLPRYGDRHPSFPDLKLVNITLTPIDVATWDGVLIYRKPTPSDLIQTEAAGTVIDRAWFAITVTEQRNTDVSGERLYHWYSGFPLTPSITGSSIKFSRSLAKQLVVKNETAEIQRPTVGTRITVIENDNIEQRVDFSGTINASRWSGYGAQTWLLGGLDSRLDQGRWVNAYELFYKPDTWKFESVVEYFGAPPSDATLGNGIARFDVYAKMNFNALPFTIA